MKKSLEKKIKQMWMLKIICCAIVLNILHNSDSTFQPIQVMCEINGFIVPAVVDTGAEISVMSSSCARRCHVSSLIDTRYSGKAVGVGSSDILGGIENLCIKIGSINFNNKFSILRNSRCDLLIGLDILNKFQCELSLKDRFIKFQIRNDFVRIPLLSAIFEEKNLGRRNFEQKNEKNIYFVESNDDNRNDYQLENDDYHVFEEDCNVSMEGV
jgi:hypothetical protein